MLRQVNPLESFPIVTVAALGRRSLSRRSRGVLCDMLNDRKLEGLLACVSLGDAAQELWDQLQARNDPPNMRIFPDAALPVLADALGTNVHDAFIRFRTGETIERKELTAVSAFLLPLFTDAPGVSTCTGNDLVRMQKEFLRGGQLTPELFDAERNAGSASCVVERRCKQNLVGLLGRLRQGAELKPRIVVVHHRQMTGASTMVRHAVLSHTADGNAIPFEMRRVPTTREEMARVAAFLKVVHDRFQSPIICIADNPDIDVVQVQVLLESTALDSIHHLVFVVTQRHAQAPLQREDGTARSSSRSTRHHKVESSSKKGRALKLRQPQHLQQQQAQESAAGYAAVHHLDVRQQLCEAEVEQFKRVFHDFEDKGVDAASENEGRDTVFLWGCAFFAGEFDAALGFIVEHVKRLSSAEADVVQAVAVMSAFSNKPLPLFVAELILDMEGGLVWDALRQARPALGSLLRDHKGLHAPLKTPGFCATLCRAAAMRRAGESLDGLGAFTENWQPDVLIRVVKDLLLPNFAIEPSHLIVKDTLAQLFSEPSGLTAELTCEQGQGLYEAALPVCAASTRPFVRANKGRHLARHHLNDAATLDRAVQEIDAGIRMAESHSASTRALSTLRAMKGRLEAQLRAGISSADTYASACNTLNSAFDRDHANDNTHAQAMHIKASLAVLQSDCVDEELRIRARGDAVRVLFDLNSSIEGGRAVDERRARLELSWLLRRLDPFLPDVNEQSIYAALQCVEDEADEASVLQLAQAPRLRKQPWPQTTAEIAKLIFRSVTQLFKHRSPLVSCYHLTQWIHAAVRCDDNTQGLWDMCESGWYLWVCDEVRSQGQLGAMLHEDKMLWQQWRLAAKLLLRKPAMNRPNDEIPRRAPLWYLHVRPRGQSKLSDISDTPPTSRLQGELTSDARVLHERFQTLSADAASLEALPHHVRLNPEGTRVQFVLGVRGLHYLATHVEVCAEATEQGREEEKRQERDCV